MATSFAAPRGTARAQPSRLGNAAQVFIEQLSQGRFAAASGMLDASTDQLLSRESIEEAWASLELRYGDFVGVGQIGMEEVEGFEVVHLGAKFERAELEIQVIFNPKSKITGLFFSSPSESARVFIPPTYTEDLSFVEEDYTVTTEDLELGGSLTLPRGEGPFAVVLLIAGAGSADRDETIGPNKPLRDIAWGLAAHGIASLRYDKRTLVFPTRFDIRDLTYREEFVEDALSAIALLREDERIDRTKIFLLGHGLGGQLAPEIALEARSTRPLLIFSPTEFLAGVIIMAGPARWIGETKISDLYFIAREDNEISFDERSVIQAVESEFEAMIESGDRDYPPVMGMSYKYMKALQDYDCLKTAQRTQLPMLIVQGERDSQVTVEGDLALWREALKDREDVTTRVYPDLNHLFMPGVGPSTRSEFAVASHVSQEFIDDLASWILQVSTPSQP